AGNLGSHPSRRQPPAFVNGVPPLKAKLIALGLIALALCCTPPHATADPVVAANFAVEDLSPNLWFYIPTCLAYLPDGRLLVGQKGGQIYVVKNGIRESTPLWDANLEILDSDDCGLMSIAIDPHYYQNHYLYFLYTVDPD